VLLGYQPTADLFYIPQVLVVQAAEEKEFPTLDTLAPKSEIFFFTDLLEQFGQ
jgi:hypothetical protein